MYACVSMALVHRLGFDIFDVCVCVCVRIYVSVRLAGAGADISVTPCGAIMHKTVNSWLNNWFSNI